MLAKQFGEIVVLRNDYNGMINSPRLGENFHILCSMEPKFLDVPGIGAVLTPQP